MRSVRRLAYGECLDSNVICTLQGAEFLKCNGVMGKRRKQMDYNHPSISSDTHDANDLDVALRGAVRSNPPSGIRHVTMHTGNVMLKEKVEAEGRCRQPGISRDTHDANHLDVALRGAVRSNSPSGIRHVTLHVGDGLLIAEREVQLTTVMAKGEAH